MSESETKRPSRGERFILYILKIIHANAAKAAALKRADNPALEYQSWEILSAFGIDLTHEQERSIFSLIASAVAKGKAQEDGFIGVGAAIANCYTNKSLDDQAHAKLRRLIACDTVEELCAVLRPLLQLILSKTGNTLKFGRLLDELLKFQWEPLKIKARWAQNFYGQQPMEEEENVC